MKEGHFLKRIVLLLLCLLLALPLVAVAESAVLTIDDVNALTDNGNKTVQDYINTFTPDQITWEYMGAPSGETAFTLGVAGGSVTISVKDAKNYQDADEGIVGASTLKGSVLEKDAQLIGVYWFDEALQIFPLPHGIKIGTPRDELAQAISGIEFLALEPGEVEDDYDETAWCSLTLPSGEDCAFDFFLQEGLLNQVQMSIYADAE